MTKTSFLRVRPWVLLLVLAAGTLRCSENNVQPPTPTAIAMVDGNGQTGVAGESLANPLVVVVTDEKGDPVQGVSVHWDAGGSGSVSSGSVETGANGRASVQRVLGPQPGEQSTTASVAGLSGSPVTFLAIATDGESSSLAVTTQPSATAESGVALGAQPVVQLRDPDGNDLAQSGVAVTASLATGSGTLGGTLTEATNGAGGATFTDLAITGPAGTYTIRFSAPDFVPAVSSAITVSTQSGNTILLITNPPTAALDREVFDPAVQPVVQVRDGSGNPVPGVGVTASLTGGGGTLEGTTTSTTDAQGFAKFGDLGIDGAGAQTLEFSTGLTSVTATPVTLSALPSEATSGKWGPVVAWDIVPLHIHLLPSGKVLGWGKDEDGGVMGTMATRPRLWDPAAGPPTSAIEVQADTMLFCSGHTLMADGRLMVTGGHKRDNVGIDVTNNSTRRARPGRRACPKAILGRPVVQVWLAGSKMLVTSIPTLSLLCPPVTIRRPSAISVWPEQKSIVSACTSIALVGGPAAGSHRRGRVAIVPITPPSSYLPHPRAFPLGNRWMCSGTMSQATTGPHFPLVASDGSADRVTGVAVTLVKPILNSRVCAPAPSMPRSPNFAKSWASVVDVVVPSNVPPPPVRLAVTPTPGTGLPEPSLTWTTGCTAGSKTSRSSAAVGGLVISRIVLPDCVETVIAEETAGTKSGAENRIV